jgi:hypothetical protein
MHTPRFALVLGLFAAATSYGQTVYINSVPLTFEAQPTEIVGAARYRLDQTNWDMGILNHKVATGGLTAADTVAKNLGTVAALSGDTFSFTIGHQAGEGLFLTLNNISPNPVPSGGTVAWGSGFSPALNPAPGSGEIKSTLGGFAPPSNFNFLQLRLQAQNSGLTNSNTNNNSTPFATMQLSNLSFTSVATEIGSFNTTSISNQGAVATDTVWSDTNLASFDWYLTGEVRGVTNITAQERVKFEVKMGQVAIPEPSTYAALMGLVALAGVVVWRRSQIAA